MTAILRLQGLDVKASTKDIRAFFESLHIPDGGVYVLGGSLREAFIAFTTERDAQQAMRYTGNLLKGSMVTLYKSSMGELEHKLKALLKRGKPSPIHHAAKKRKQRPDAKLRPKARPSSCNKGNLKPARAVDPNTANPPQPISPANSCPQALNAHTIDSSTAFLLGICTVLQGLQSCPRETKEAVTKVDFNMADEKIVSDGPNTAERTLNSKSGYVRLFGLPATATKEDICRFFQGLTVEEVIVNVELGLGHGCLVKFATTQDASDALLFNEQSLGPLCVEVRGATEKMWTSALQEYGNVLDKREKVGPTQSPLKETANHRPKSNSTLQMKRKCADTSPHKSLKNPRADGDSDPLSPTNEYIVMVQNLPTIMTKTQIKQLFGCPDMAHRNVLHLLDKEGNRTNTAFLIFNRAEDYDYAMNLTGCHVGSDTIEVSSVSRVTMKETMAKTKLRSPEVNRVKPNHKRRPETRETLEEAPSVNLDPAAKTCLLVRNMPADVQKSQIQRLFSKYKPSMDDINLLFGSDGQGTGEAVVQFKSQALAALAQRHHGQVFLGEKVLLSCINVEQMEDILQRNIQQQR